MEWFILIVSLTVANFLFCIITKKPMSVAAERSFFQAVAILICWESKPWL